MANVYTWMSSHEKADYEETNLNVLAFEKSWRKTLIQHVEKAEKSLANAVKSAKKQCTIARENALTYKTEYELMEAYGWGVITERQFDEAKKLLENVDNGELLPEEIAYANVKEFLRIFRGDLAEYERAYEARDREREKTIRSMR